MGVPARLEGFRTIQNKPSVVEVELSVGLYRCRTVSMASQDPLLESTSMSF